MSYALVVVAIAAVLVATAFVLIFRRLVARGNSDALADLEWSVEFSVAKYRPMERLFLEEDYDFLAAQPGFHPRIFRKLQAERRRVFRHYLRCLRKDFERLSNAAKLLMIAAPSDRPELASAIMKQRFLFTYAMTVVEVRLVLQGLGIGTVDVRRLVNAIEGMGEQYRCLAQHASGVSAA